jgi:hypothetical protein
MNPETVDLMSVIAHLEGKRAAIDNAIAALRAVMSADASGPSPEGGVASIAMPFGTSISTVEVPDGAFHSKSMPAAIRLYLEIMRSKKSTREISDGLKKGGLESTSQNFEKIVYATLDRLRKSGDIIKLGTAWGLPAWYPALMRAGASEGKPAKRRGRPRKATEAQDQPKLLPVSGKGERNKKLKSEPNSIDMIDWFLRDHPGSHTPEEIRDAAKMSNTRAAQMLLGRMIKSGTVQKTEDGKYRKAS